MGLSLGEAIESFGRRADTPNVRLFVRTLTQGERLGVSIGTAMRGLALEMRKRRRAMMEEIAQKMPVKMLFPMIFLIFPAMFIILLVPMGINIYDVFVGGGSGGGGGGDRAEDASEDALPDDLPDLPGDVHRPARPDGDQHHGRFQGRLALWQR